MEVRGSRLTLVSTKSQLKSRAWKLSIFLAPTPEPNASG